MVFRFILVSALCFFSLFLNAQNELEFNKVINEKITGSGGSISKSVTVPAGKVWKITAASAGYKSGSAGTFIGTSLLAFTLNDFSLFYRTGNSIESPAQSFPFWLPAGTYTMKLYCTNSNFSLVGTISVLEFNVKK